MIQNYLIQPSIMIAILLIISIASFATACPQNCLQCFNNSPFCIACNSGYQLSLTIECIAQNIVPHCAFFTNETHCQRCQPTFTLQNNTCIKEYSGCINYDAINRQCYQCYFGKMLVNGTCKGALKCSSSSEECQTCAQGWSLTNPNNCTDLTGNCQQLSKYGVCQKCRIGFKLVGYQCVIENFYVQNCYVFNQIDRCLICKDGFSQVLGECLTGNEIAKVQGGKSVSEVILLRNGGSSLNSNNGGGNNQVNNNPSTTQTTANNQKGNQQNIFATDSIQPSNQPSTGESSQNTFSNGAVPPSNQPSTGGSQQNTFSNGAVPPSNQPSTGGSSQNTFSNGAVPPSNQPSTGESSQNTFSNGAVPPSNQPSTGESSQNTFETGQNIVDNQNFQGSGQAPTVIDPQHQTQPQTQPQSQSQPSGIVSPQPIANCLQTDQNNPQFCLQCDNNYIFIFPSCIFISPLCQNYNPSTGICLNCISNIPLINDQCIDPNCQQKNLTHCLACNTGYQLNNVNNLCQITFTNCLVPTALRCQECQPGFFVTIQGQCRILPDNCLIANMQTYMCLQCSQGFQIRQGFCQKAIVIPHCLQVGITGTCQNCEQGYYPQGSVCQPVSPLCQTYNQITGLCITCITGYIIKNQQCIDPNCQQLSQNNKCILCKSKYYLQPSSDLCQQIPISFCLQVNNNIECVLCQSGYRLNQNLCIDNSLMVNCQQFSNALNRCTSCLPGFVLDNNYSCTLPKPPPPAQRDINCKQFKGDVCLVCSQRFYFQSQGGKCVPVSPLCQGYDSVSGWCTSCYSGYLLTQSGSCVVQAPMITNCQKQDKNGICTQCYSGFFIKQGSCQPLNPLCKAYDYSNGDCTNCYPGYNLFNGKCTVFAGDPNCLKNNPNGGCLNCSRGFFLDNNGVCKQVNPLCKGADLKGLCIDCYPGYTLVSGACVIGMTKVQNNCFKVENGVCVKCFSRYYLNPQGQCNQINPLCKTFNQGGACTSCYPGYSLRGGDCVISTTGGTGQQNCAKVDERNVCTKCYSGYYLSVGKLCVNVNDLCKTRNDLNTICTSCYDGYNLTPEGACVIATVVNQQKDPFCMIWEGNICTQCVTGYYLPTNEVCTLANPICKGVDSTGACTSCYQGYELEMRTCVIITAPSIAFCTQQVNSICRQCLEGYYPLNGQCSPVSILCATYDRQTGECFSCRDGYVFQGGDCIRPSLGVDPNCKTYSGSYCSQCNQNYELISFWCTPSNSQCLQMDPISQTCILCPHTLTPSGKSCI